MVVKGDREDHRDDKQHDQYTLVFSADHQQTKEAKREDHQFRYHHIRQDCPDEKAVFTLVEREANGTMMPDMKRAFYDRTLATRRTTQLQGALQCPNSLLFIDFHDRSRILRPEGPIRKR